MEPETKLHKIWNPTVKEEAHFQCDGGVLRGPCFYWIVVLWSKSTWVPRVLFVPGLVQTFKKRDGPWMKCSGVLGFAFVLLGPKNILSSMFIYLYYLIICRKILEWAVHNLSDKLVHCCSGRTSNTTEMQIASAEPYLLSDCPTNVAEGRCYLSLGSGFVFVFCLQTLSKSFS